jgi:PIN domain nuclease of toxin-antitoxin system
VAEVISLDTHVVAWLFAGEHQRLSTAGRRAVEEHDLLVSPAVVRIGYS